MKMELSCTRELHFHVFDFRKKPCFSTLEKCKIELSCTREHHFSSVRSLGNKHCFFSPFLRKPCFSMVFSRFFFLLPPKWLRNTSRRASQGHCFLRPLPGSRLGAQGSQKAQKVLDLGGIFHRKPPHSKLTVTNPIRPNTSKH